MSKKVQFLIIFTLLTLTQNLSAAVYNCRMNSPKPSLFFERNVKIECDLDAQAKPKLVILGGTTKVPLNQKAEYMGKDNSMYEMHRMYSLDGQSFELHTATTMFTETVKASFFTLEPGGNSGLWICYIEQ